ncbi:hypothetical protein [Limnoglobus roseus]|uniref:Uncharacterized protein n=1 Tax=Limnoglobus roseus TaxID=2598579 RepID=A0A5C1AGK6_9BACT|nr:hypothetical protein [Limnoglobus roseus]QEL16088.1 hypothetical protein PX52LOC_03027 [Limnoglobus roseus]
MAISLAVLAGVGGAAFGQQPSVVPPALPAAPPVTKWTPFNQTPPAPPPVPAAPPVVLPAPQPIPDAPFVESAVPLPVLPPTTAPVSNPPGLVPNTLTFQKSAGDSVPMPPTAPLTFQKGAGEIVPMVSPAPGVPSLPPMGVPAIPTRLVRTPADEKDDAKAKQDEKDREEARKRLDEETKRKEPPKATDRQSDLTKGTLPSRQNVFRLTSDADLDARIQKESTSGKNPFPKPAPLSAEPLVYQAKTASYPPMKTFREPTYVVHRRLYFEEMNSERAGWEIGFLQPFLSAGYFYKDLFFLPHNAVSGLWKNRWDTSAGKCQPGAPTPYYLYPQGFTLSGLMFQATLLTGLPFIFPG